MDPDTVTIVISPLKHLQIAQAEELERVFIKPLVINQDISHRPLVVLLTSSLSTSQNLKKRAYSAITVSPEQFFSDPSSGATPRLLGLLRSNHDCFRSVKHVFIDEGHELSFSGLDCHGIPAFRPSCGNLGKVSPKLPDKTTIHLLSATPTHTHTSPGSSKRGSFTTGRGLTYNSLSTVGISSTQLERSKILANTKAFHSLFPIAIPIPALPVL